MGDDSNVLLISSLTGILTATVTGFLAYLREVRAKRIESKSSKAATEAMLVGETFTAEREFRRDLTKRIADLEARLESMQKEKNDCMEVVFQLRGRVNALEDQIRDNASKLDSMTKDKGTE